jgi:adenylosuccinate synthase
MARVGNEFGSVTGRQRRCGWLDLVALKYAIQERCYAIDDDEKMCFQDSKLWKFVQINYKGENSTLSLYIEPENVTPVYKNFKGWKADLTGMTTYEELPKLKIYWVYWKEVEVPIKIVSVGPDRKQTILNKIKNALKFQGVFNYSIKPLLPYKNI